MPYSEIAWRLEISKPTIIRWKERFQSEGLHKLDTSHPSPKPFKRTPALQAKVLAATRRKPTDGSTQPAQHIFCVDEKTAIQALDQLDPVLPLTPGRPERHGFESYRHGMLSR
jgi:hypothetical protein